MVGTLAVIYGVFLAVVVFWPTPIDRPVRGLLDRVIEELHERGVPEFVDYAVIEFGANIALFLPVGVLLGLAIPMRWTLLTLILGPALSAGIEFAQSQVLDERYSTVSDVVANSIGSTIGVLIALTLRAMVAMRDERVIARYEAEREFAVSPR
ncbi:VanZ family protein [Microbacterium sediminis]|nr:VanZ family protein [Microbacterium sediminis]QBR74974.1 VanZ family protein [Microbacterium sediminis]